MTKTDLNGSAPEPHFDESKNAVVHEKLHLLPENKLATITKEYHTYCVDDLENNVQGVDDNIKLFRAHIKKEQVRKAELLELITEGKERDIKLAELET